MANNKTQKKKQRRSRHNGGTKTPSSKTASSKTAISKHPLLTEAKSVGKDYLVKDIRKILKDSTMSPKKKEEALAQKKILVDLAKTHSIRASIPHTQKINDQFGTQGSGSKYTAMYAPSYAANNP